MRTEFQFIENSLPRPQDKDHGLLADDQDSWLQEIKQFTEHYVQWEFARTPEAACESLLKRGKEFKYVVLDDKFGDVQCLERFVGLVNQLPADVQVIIASHQDRDVRFDREVQKIRGKEPAELTRYIKQDTIRRLKLEIHINSDVFFRSEMSDWAQFALEFRLAMVHCDHLRREKMLEACSEKIRIQANKSDQRRQTKWLFAVDLLLEAGYSGIGQLLQDLIQRPSEIDESHVRMTARLRDVPWRGMEQSSAAVDVVCAMVESATQTDAISRYPALIVESIRTASFLSAKLALDRFGRWLPQVGQMEMTAVLEEVADAARRLRNANPTPDLCQAISSVWEQVISRPQTFGNLPGIASRLLELARRFDHANGSARVDYQGMIQSARTLPEWPRILPLFLQRPLEMFRPDEVRDLFLQAFQLPEIRETRATFATLIQAFARNADPLDFRRLIVDKVHSD